MLYVAEKQACRGQGLVGLEMGVRPSCLIFLCYKRYPCHT